MITSIGIEIVGMKKQQLIRKKNIRGFTLLEVLVAVFVFAIGLLGLAGLQTLGMRSSQDAYLRTQAATLANEMYDRLQMNFAAGDAYHLNDTTANDVVESCQEIDLDTDGEGSAEGCTRADFADNDIAEWRANLARLLPQGQGIVCRDPTPDDGNDAANHGCPNTPAGRYTIKIWWSERDTFDEDGDADTEVALQRFIFSAAFPSP